MFTEIDPVEIEARQGSRWCVRASDRARAESPIGRERSARALNRPRAGRPQKGLDAQSGQVYDALGLTGTRSAKFTRVEGQ